MKSYAQMLKTQNLLVLLKTPFDSVIHYSWFVSSLNGYQKYKVFWKDEFNLINRRVPNAKRFEAYKNATLNREYTKAEEIIITPQIPSSNWKSERTLFECQCLSSISFCSQQELRKYYSMIWTTQRHSLCKPPLNYFLVRFTNFFKLFLTWSRYL